ncbi:MAG: hypothetical protein AABX04_02510 [Nanoarchaeota archaeon]
MIKKTLAGLVEENLEHQRRVAEAIDNKVPKETALGSTGRVYPGCRDEISASYGNKGGKYAGN